MSDARAAGDEALHEQREWLRVTLSSIGDAVITTDTDGGVTFLNPVAQSLTGWTQDEAAGKPLVEVFRDRQRGESPSRSRTRRPGPCGTASSSGWRTTPCSSPRTARNGPSTTVPPRSAMPRGEVAGVVLVFRDITERRRHEQPGAGRPRLRRQHHRDAAGAVPRPRREPAGQDGQPLLLPRPSTSRRRRRKAASLYDLGNGQWDIPRLRTLLKEVLSDQPSRSTTSRSNTTSRPSGEGPCCSTPAASRRTGDAPGPDPARHRGHHRPQAGGSRRAGLRSPLPAALRDGQGRHPHPRRRHREDHRRQPVHDGAAGLLARRVPGQGTLGDRPVPGQVGRARPPSGNCRRRATSATSTCRWKPRAGEQVEVEFVSNVYQVDDRPVTQCNIRDITERSRLERQTQEQAAALADLHRRKDEFLAMLSHELRNPLAPIVNAVHLLRLQGDENPLQQQARAIIERQVGQLTRLVDDLLEVSRITTGRIQLQPGAGRPAAASWSVRWRRPAR